ncbi:hypothetical protein BGZ79_000284 [Entomortierella chlamydospora]|nr:hypothetical protein BGZ79_000284 [Entomortierella chlamydospora]
MLSSKEGSSTKEAINCATVTCLRDKISNPISRMDHGNYVFTPRQNGLYIRGESSFWEITHDYRTQTVGAVSTPQKVQELLEELGLLNYLPNKASAWKDAMINRIGQVQHGREVSLMMSNIGVGWKRPVPTSSQLLVKDGIFSSSPIKTYGAFNMSIATVNGILSVVTAWDKAAFKERARAELFVSEFKRILLEAVEDGRETYLFKDAKRPYDDNTTAIAL